MRQSLPKQWDTSPYRTGIVHIRRAVRIPLPLVRRGRGGGQILHAIAADHPAPGALPIEGREDAPLSRDCTYPRAPRLTYSPRIPVHAGVALARRQQCEDRAADRAGGNAVVRSRLAASARCESWRENPSIGAGRPKNLPRGGWLPLYFTTQVRRPVAPCPCSPRTSRGRPRRATGVWVLPRFTLGCAARSA
jgi:hypothetical protein